MDHRLKDGWLFDPDCMMAFTSWTGGQPICVCGPGGGGGGRREVEHHIINEKIFGIVDGRMAWED